MRRRERGGVFQCRRRFRSYLRDNLVSGQAGHDRLAEWMKETGGFYESYELNGD